MIISLIVAYDRNRGIGINNTLPWRLRADLRFFKERTTGHHILFGRKTYESIGKPLPNRTTIIITRSIGYTAAGCLVEHSVESAIELARERGETECFICGGAEIYALALPFATRIYATEVDATVNADTFFPALGNGWHETEKTYHHADEHNEYNMAFITLERQ
ncbi:MAG: dihydrofolate reductase [Candidatus Kapabacteria bacterium]|nr:dihydrofolate reductase [Candidatus Kapabacteria bacterium]